MNDTLLPNKMTKSYLLESDPYLKTSSKTASPFAALNSDDNVFRDRTASVWNGGHYQHHHHGSAIPGDLISDRPTVKPLAMHNVPSNLPPIAYINGNSVRPVRCRHYSQQQTVFHNNNNVPNIHNNNSANSHSNSEKPNSGIKVAAAGDMSHCAQSENANGANEFGGKPGAGDKASQPDSRSSSAKAGSPDEYANGFSFSSTSSSSSSSMIMAPKSHASQVKVQSADSSSEKAPAAGPGQQSQPDRQRAGSSPSRQSSSSPSTTQRDYVTNNENESSIYSLYENTEQVIDHLAKKMEAVLRSAKESRRLMCTELLVPQYLTAQIAADVIELAECEPCGLRGCLLYICIEDNSGSGQNGFAGSKQQQQHKLSEHSHQGHSTAPQVSSRLLGEVALDRSVVPTFEVFLTLKRTNLNWFESLENKLLRKERVILSELYLLHKKKLYQTPSSPTM